VFDNTQRKIQPEHIVASGALPPGFPAVTIDGVAYWDSLLVSNTPLQFVLDADSANPLVILQVDLFNAAGAMPSNLTEVRDIPYSSRTRMKHRRLHESGQGRLHRRIFYDEESVAMGTMSYKPISLAIAWTR
jgi:predicted acylesterase/phospholipase RssA